MNEGRGIAGKGPRNLGDRRYTSRQKYLRVLIVCGAVLIFLMPLGFRPGLGIGALLLMLVVLALIKAVGRRIDQSVNEISIHCRSRLLTGVRKLQQAR